MRPVNNRLKIRSIRVAPESTRLVPLQVSFVTSSFAVTESQGPHDVLIIDARVNGFCTRNKKVCRASEFYAVVAEYVNYG